MKNHSDFDRIKFEAGEILFREGDEAHEAYLILDGAVEIRAGAKRNTPLILGVRGKDEVIGEMALFDDSPRMATATATESTMVMVIPRDKFNKQVDLMTPAMRGIFLHLIKRMREMADDL